MSLAAEVRQSAVLLGFAVAVTGGLAGIAALCVHVFG
jgi:hypothetical protein